MEEFVPVAAISVHQITIRRHPKYPLGFPPHVTTLPELVFAVCKAGYGGIGHGGCRKCRVDHYKESVGDGACIGCGLGATTAGIRAATTCGNDQYAYNIPRPHATLVP